MRIIDSIRHIRTILLATAAVCVVGFGCNQGSEGDRCNAALNTNGHDECNGGLTCTNVPLCPETYCCPLNADGSLAKSDNPNCQTGCNGGAASICNSGMDDAGACAFACKNDPGDLTNSSVCAAPDGGTPEAGASEAGASEGGASEGGRGVSPEASAPEASTGNDGGTTDAARD
jgi:hypothetical protein